MPDDNVIPFPKKPSETVAYMTSFGSLQIVSHCTGIVHYFDDLPGYCKCGKEHWDGGTVKTNA